VPVFLPYLGYALGVAALSYLASGCTSKRDDPKKRITPKGNESVKFDGRIIQLPRKDFRVERHLAGDPKLGSVIWIRDLHAPPFKAGSENPGIVLEYQWQVLGLLEMFQPRNIFYEEEPFSGGLNLALIYLDRSPIGINKEWLNFQELRSMPTVSGKKPSSEVSSFVARFGAPIAHLLRHPDEAEIHRTLSPEESVASRNALKRILSCEKQHGAQAKKCNDLSQEHGVRRREAWATREMIHYLRDHPGAYVILLFGAAHQFCDDFIRENFRPEITMIEYNFNRDEFPVDYWPKAVHCQ